MSTDFMTLQTTSDVPDIWILHCDSTCPSMKIFYYPRGVVSHGNEPWRPRCPSPYPKFRGVFKDLEATDGDMTTIQSRKTTPHIKYYRFPPSIPLTPCLLHYCYFLLFLEKRREIPRIIKSITITRGLCRGFGCLEITTTFWGRPTVVMHGD